MAEIEAPGEAPGLCPICKGQLNMEVTENEQRIARVHCAVCGDHRVVLDELRLIPGFGYEAHVRARIAFGVSKLPAGTFVTSELMNQLANATDLPGALERIDNLLYYIADKYEPGEGAGLLPQYLRVRLGCFRQDEAAWVIQQAQALGYVDEHRGSQGLYCLSAKGWERHAELERSGARSTHAFMAMKFADAEMDRVFGDFMRPAVAQTGFDLRTTVGDHQTAGSIDNRMRVEIRNSRFVLCDLTHSNQGAYWEAGFAEGLGRPVIYTCRGDVLDTPRAVHFDTAHQLIIRWDLANMDAAMQELKASIRATLPAEAKMEDT